jgi:hypothetical protein
VTNRVDHSTRGTRQAKRATASHEEGWYLPPTNCLSRAREAAGTVMEKPRRLSTARASYSKGVLRKRRRESYTSLMKEIPPPDGGILTQGMEIMARKKQAATARSGSRRRRKDGPGRARRARLGKMPRVVFVGEDCCLGVRCGGYFDSYHRRRGRCHSGWRGRILAWQEQEKLGSGVGL